MFGFLQGTWWQRLLFSGMEDMNTSFNKAFRSFIIIVVVMISIFVCLAIVLSIVSAKHAKRISNGGENSLFTNLTDGIKKVSEVVSDNLSDTVTCVYCGGTYKKDELKCPHCGASKVKTKK